MKAYHFTNNTLRNGQPIPSIGKWLIHPGEIKPCHRGLHASEHPFDALKYAPGVRLHLVELEVDLVSHGNPIDKWVGRKRKIIASIDATSILRHFACQCALSVAHYWNAPDIVLQYLFTEDESIRKNAAAAAADDAAYAAAAAAAAADDAAAAAAADDAAYAAAAAAAYSYAAAAAATKKQYRNDFLALVESQF